MGSDAHTIKMWAQVLSGLEPDNNTAYKAGCKLLPNMQWYFFASTSEVKKYLKSIQE